MTKPYFQNDTITLYHGDCGDHHIPCDLIVTDPPYGQNYQSNKASIDWGKIAGDDDAGAIVLKLAHVLKSLRRGRHIYIFGNKFDLPSLPLSGFTELIWDKELMGMGDLAAPWGSQHEYITFATYEPSKANRAKGYGNLSARLRKGSVIRSMRANSHGVKNHPTEKPVDVLRQLIESSSVLGETVYDPFAGSGSTLIAAALEGRNAVGCEIEERYCEVAAKRFDQELKQ